MDKNGFVVFWAFMIGTLFFLLGLALAPSIKDVISEATTTAELNCSNETISQQDQAICTQMDLMNFLFIGLLFGMAGFILGGIAT